MTYMNSYEKEGCIFKSNPPYNRMPNRTIITNEVDKDVCNNEIKTSKYTILTFLPLNLLVQFSKIPNMYFLIVGIMQMIPQITISGGFPVIFVPLSIVIGISITKDFFEDLKRAATDQEINNKVCNKLQAQGYVPVKWSTLKIGDIVKVSKAQQFPADLILLQSSQQKLNCFIETKNLDGETNLKSKQVKFEVGEPLRKYSESCLYSQRLQFQYQRPNPFIHTFTGSYKTVPLDNNNVALRGCTLRITEWVVGVVIYTGIDSKIMLNSNKSRQKKSRLEFRMGLAVIGIFILQMLLTLISAIISILKENSFHTLFTNQLLIKWGSWILLFTNFVPISLIVSLQMVKYLQGINISESNYSTTEPASVKVQSSCLNEQLGQIQHLFSDKTGTLTKNYMIFKYMVIGNKIYGYDEDSRSTNIDNVDFHDSKFMEMLQNSRIPQQIYHMMVGLSLCHNVIIEENQGYKKYNASSPDQLAFINMMHYCGWNYQGLNANHQLEVQTPHQILKYKLLHTIEFNSDRKRMSVILQHKDQIYLYTKGADNVIIDKLNASSKKQLKITEKAIHQWSISGLRTLVFGMRKIKKSDYEKWAKMYAYSLSCIDKIQKKQNKQMKKDVLNQGNMERMQQNQTKLQSMSKLIISDGYNFDEINNQSLRLINEILNDNAMLSENQKQFIEKYLQELDTSCTATVQQLQDVLQQEYDLLGATAIQDKLQDNVKSTLKSIKEAGVKVWMLTGDKKETAVNIGLSCGLIGEKMCIIDFNMDIERTIAIRQQNIHQPSCIVINGDELCSQQNNQTLLLQLINSCQAIICCRVTPKQKQDMVWLMRKNKFITMSVGDGANDVNMINTAHIGIGIKGVQGAQAALCSDYAISQFQILGELMLYHGREAYRKNSNLILFTFYKNLLLVVPQFWFGFRSQFSGATIYDPWIYQLYNVMFTSAPILVHAIWDHQYSPSYSLKHPELYHKGIHNTLFSKQKIVYWLLPPILYSLWLQMINFGIIGNTLSEEGYMFDMMSVGMCIFVQCVIICNLKVLIISFSNSIGLYLTAIISIFFFYISCAVQTIFMPYQQSIKNSLYSINYWVCNALNILVIILIEIALCHYELLFQSEIHKTSIEIKKNPQKQIQMLLLPQKQ